MPDFIRWKHQPRDCQIVQFNLVNNKISRVRGHLFGSKIYPGID